MSKETYYFSHDYSSRSDPKLQKVLMRLGQSGKGVFWDLIEMLYEQEGYLLLNEIESYAFALRTDSETINSLINDFDLFKKNDENFWSNSVLKRLDKRDEKSKKASDSAKTRWDKANALKLDANALENDAIKESKGEERKEIKVVVAKESDFFRNNFSSHHLNRSLIETQKIPPEKITELIEIFIDQKTGFDELKGKDFNDLCKNFYYWVPKYLKANKEEKQNGYKKIRSGLRPTGIEPSKNKQGYGKL